MRCAVKICGITNEADALEASSMGADFIGLIFARESPRFVDFNEAKKICDSLCSSNSHTGVVGVFVSEDAPLVEQYYKKLSLAAVQLHGGQGGEFIEKLRNMGVENIWSAVWPDKPEDVDLCAESGADVLVVDSRRGKLRGGTGERADWLLAGRLAKIRKVMLAGGICAENALEALEAVRPWGMDANSAVEFFPGKKDGKKIFQLLKKIGG